MHGNQSQLLKK